MNKKIGNLLLVVFLTMAFLHGSQKISVAKDKLVSSVSREFSDGEDARILSLIAQRLGLDIEMNYVSFARRLVLMKQGKIDICSGLHNTMGRERYIYFIEPAYKTVSKKVFIVLKGNKGIIKEYDDLYRLSIGTIIGAAYFEKFDNDRRLIKVKVSNAEQKFDMLMNNRVNTVIHSYEGALKTIHKMGIADKVETAEYYHLDNIPVYIGISKKSDIINRAKEVEHVIREIVGAGGIDRLLSKP